MEVKVYGQDGSEAGRSVSLDESVFGIKPNDHAIWLDVRRIQAAGRQGTHKAKERGEVAGSTRKLYRQKGTGFARAGSAKSPIRKSGGTMFGPRPRSYDMKVNRKTQRLARRSALTYKAQADALRVVESLALEGPSTRQLRTFVEQLGLSDRKTLLLTVEHRPEVYQSSRNLPKVDVRQASLISTLDVLLAQVIVLEEGALDVLREQLGTAVEA